MKYGSHLIFDTVWSKQSNCRQPYFANPSIASAIAEAIEKHAKEIGLIPMAVAVQPDHIHIYVKWNMNTPREKWIKWPVAMSELRDCATITLKTQMPKLQTRKILSWYHFKEVRGSSYHTTVKRYINRQAEWYSKK